VARERLAGLTGFEPRDRNAFTRATWWAAMSDGAWPASATCANSVSGLVSSIWSSTSRGKMRERSPRTSNTGQRTRYHELHNEMPGEKGAGCAIDAMRGS
jgi:hypothetical protein